MLEHGWSPSNCMRTNRDICLKEFNQLVAAASSHVQIGGKVDSSVVLVTMCLPAENHMGPPDSAHTEPSLFRRARTAVIKNHDDYAYKRGYMTRLHTEMPQCSRSTAWLKLPVMFSAIAQPLVKYAFWADCDVIFLNFLLPLPLPVSQSVDGVFSAERGLSANFPSATCNTGAFLLRASPWALRLLITAWTVYPVPSPGRWWEQSAFIYLFTGEQPACRASILEAGCRGRPAGPWSSRVSILPPEVIGAGIWHLRGRHPNPLLVHLMGDIYGSSEDKATILISVAKTRNASRVHDLLLARSIISGARTKRLGDATPDMLQFAFGSRSPGSAWTGLAHSGKRNPNTNTR